MIKDILVNIDASRSSDFAADFAISIAANFRAHVVGLAFTYEPAREQLLGARFVAEYRDVLRAEGEQAANAAIAKFEGAARQEDVSVESHRIPVSFVGASETFGRIARRFDLAVLGQAEPNDVMGEDLMIAAALFDSGRPVMIVPYIQRAGLKLDRVMVCWDGSRAAARALGDALPFLVRSKRVDVVMVTGEPAKRDEIPGFEIGRHLARHGINTNLAPIGGGGTDVTTTLLNYVDEEAIDLIVMGAYGHSRFREFVLGGVTRGILGSMTVPTLMSH